MSEAINNKVRKSECASEAWTLESKGFSPRASENPAGRAIFWLDGVKADEDDVTEEFWVYVKGYN